MNSFYIYIASDDCVKKFPNNTIFDFKVELPEELVLIDGEWSVALIEIYIYW